MPLFVMDFLIFSDIHCHNFKFGSKWVIDEELGPISSRLLDSIKCIRQVFDYAVKHNITHVFFAGDLFHVPDKPPTEVVSAVYKTIANRPKSIQLYMIPGNHDISSKSGLNHALIPFSDVCTVVNDYSRFEVGDCVSVSMVPYRESKSSYLDLLNQAAVPCSFADCDILISHIGVQGATVGADYVLENDADVALSDLPLESFDHSFFGHFHQHQKLADNAHYIGATHQHNWGDAGTERGFLHVSAHMGDVKFTRVPLEAPKFHKVKVGGSVSHIKSGDFVTITAVKDVGAVKTAAMEALPDVGYLTVKLEKEVPVTSVVTLPTSYSQHELLTAWIGTKAHGTLDKKKLLNLGLELLGEASVEEE